MSDLRKLSDVELLMQFEEEVNLIPTIGEIVRRWCTRLLAVEECKKWREVKPENCDE